MTLVDIVAQDHDNGLKCSSGPRRWWKVYFRSITMVKSEVQDIDNGGKCSSGLLKGGKCSSGP